MNVQVIIGGQALSHCVNYTTRDLLRYWTARNPADLIMLIDGECRTTARAKYIAYIHSVLLLTCM